MTMTVGMRDLARNSNILDGYNYVDVEDKKTHEFKSFLEDKTAKDLQEQLDEIDKFAGTMEFEDRYKGLEGKELMIEVSKAKCGL